MLQRCKTLRSEFEKLDFRYANFAATKVLDLKNKGNIIKSLMYN